MKLSTLLAKTSPLEIFLHFTPDLDESNIKKSGNPGKNISSPFIDDNNPSFSVYEDRSGKLKFKCHSSGQQGDCFQLVADLNDLDCKTQFNEVLKLINEKMKLGLEDQKRSSYNSEIWKAEYYESFSKKALEFWETRKVDIPTLEKFGVRQLKKLTYNKKSQYDYHKDSVVAFEFTVNGRKKLYVPSGPNPDVKKRYFCKTQNKSDIFGLRQLDRKKQKFLLICEGEGDVLCAAAHGLPAVCFQSATTIPTHQQMRELRRKASNLLLCYDLDDAGRKAVSKLTWDFPFLIDLKIPPNSNYWINEEGIIELLEQESEAKEKYKDLSDWLPNASVHDFENLITTSIKESRKKRHLHIWEMGTSYMKFDPKASSNVEVSNFLLQVDAQVFKEDESLRLCRLVSRNRTTDTLAIPSTVLNSDTKFSDYVTNLRGNFRFQGTKRDLQVIQKMTYELSDQLEEVGKMGWNKKHNCFILSNRVLNGKIEQPNAEGILGEMYIPAANETNLDSSEYVTDLKFRYEKDSSIKEPYQFFHYLSASYNPQVATLSFAFLFSGLFFDWIARKGVGGYFPLCGVFGQKGSGKGSLVKMLMKLFTSEPEEVSITNATKTGFVRVLEQAHNIPAWLDEFRNSLKEEKIEALKNIYDLIGKVIGVRSTDSKTLRSKILRPTFLTGQESPVNEALFSRTICLNLAIEEKSTEQIKAFSKRMTELDKGIGDLLFKLLQFRPVVTEHFKTQFFDLVEFFGTKLGEKKVKANIRLLNNYACIIAPLIIAINNGLRLTKNSTPEKEIEAVKKYALRNLIAQAAEESELDEVNKFLEVVMIMANRGELHNKYDFLVKGDTRELFIKSAVITGFNKMYKEIFTHQGPDQSAIKKYLPSKPYFKAKRREYFDVQGKAGKAQMRCVVLDLDKIPEEFKEFFEAYIIHQNQDA